MTKKVGDRDLMFLRFETKLWNRGIKYSRKIRNIQYRAEHHYIKPTISLSFYFKFLLKLGKYYDW